MRYFKKIKSDRLYLSPINPDDYELYTEWVNDSDVTKYLELDSKVLGLCQEKAALEKLSSTHTFAIVLNDGNRLIGNVGAHNIDTLNQTCEVGIFIGPDDAKSKGYGSEALKCLVEYCFNVLNMRNVMLRVFSYNPRALKAYKKVGFKEFGRRTSSKFYNGSFYDEIYMEILREN